MNKIKKTFYIPVDDVTREEAEKKLKELLNSYHDEIDITWEFDPKKVAEDKREERKKKLERIWKIIRKI